MITHYRVMIWRYCKILLLFDVNFDSSTICSIICIIICIIRNQIEVMSYIHLITRQNTIMTPMAYH